MSTVDPSTDRASIETPPASFFSNAFPSLGIGLLVGVLVALSLTPVVAGLLTTLGGLLAAILGLQQEPASDSSSALSRLRVNGTRIGAFGFATVLGVAGGLYVRNHDVFTPAVKDQIATWQDAGFSRDEAKQFVALQRFNLKPEGREIVQSDLPKTQVSALFSALSDINLCEKVSTRDKEPQTVAANYRQLDLGDEKDKNTPIYKALGALAGHIERLPPADQAAAFTEMEKFVCTVQLLETK